MHIPVKGHQDLVRDNFSKAILNVDDEARNDSHGVDGNLTVLSCSVPHARWCI